jgi:hypothetical protein
MDRQLEIKFVFPAWLFAVLFLTMVSGYFMTSWSNILLLRQRAQQDAEFMAKVKEIQRENAELRVQLGAK